MSQVHPDNIQHSRFFHCKFLYYTLHKEGTGTGGIARLAFVLFAYSSPIFPVPARCPVHTARLWRGWGKIPIFIKLARDKGPPSMMTHCPLSLPSFSSWQYTPYSIPCIIKCVVQHRRLCHLIPANSFSTRLNWVTIPFADYLQTRPNWVKLWSHCFAPYDVKCYVFAHTRHAAIWNLWLRYPVFTQIQRGAITQRYKYSHCPLPRPIRTCLKRRVTCSVAPRVMSVSCQALRGLVTISLCIVPMSTLRCATRLPYPGPQRSALMTKKTPTVCNIHFSMIYCGGHISP